MTYRRIVLLWMVMFAAIGTPNAWALTFGVFDVTEGPSSLTVTVLVSNEDTMPATGQVSSSDIDFLVPTGSVLGHYIADACRHGEHTFRDGNLDRKRDRVDGPIQRATRRVHAPRSVRAQPDGRLHSGGRRFAVLHAHGVRVAECGHGSRAGECGPPGHRPPARWRDALVLSATSTGLPSTAQRSQLLIWRRSQRLRRARG